MATSDFANLPKKCFSCGYQWKSRVEFPKACPMCKQRNYDRKKGLKGGDLFAQG